MNYYIKLDKTHNAYFKLTRENSGYIQLANDHQDESKPEVYYKLNDIDKNQARFELDITEPVYFEIMKFNVINITSYSYFRLKIDDCSSVLFKLPDEKTLSLQQVGDTQETVFFKLNDTHRFTFKSNESLHFHLKFKLTTSLLDLFKHYLPNLFKSFFIDLFKSIFSKNFERKVSIQPDPIQSYEAPIHVKIDKVDKLYFKLAFPNVVRVQLIDDQQKLYRISEMDQLNFKLANKQPFYFKVFYYSKNKYWLTAIFVKMISSNIAFKLPNEQTLTLHQADTNEIFKLNDTHRFFFESEESIYFYISKSPFERE